MEKPLLHLKIMWKTLWGFSITEKDLEDYLSDDNLWHWEA